MYLGIDLGTSSLKTILTDADFNVLASASTRLETSSLHRGWSEQHPDMWWDVLRSTLGALSAKGEARLQDVTAIGLSGQMHGAVLLDQKGRVLRPAILWNDSRSTAQCALLRGSHSHLSQIAGVDPMPGFTAPKLPWIKREEPEVFEQISQVLLPKDYLGFRLHGHYVTDPTDAAGTWWFDQGKRRWSEALCDATDTELNWLPEVRSGSDIAGALLPDIARKLGLSAGIPVAVGAGDAAAGAIAMGAVKTGTGFISLGTSGQLFVASDTFDAPQNRTVHAYAHTLNMSWFQMAAMLNGARPLDWFASVSHSDVPTLLTEADVVATDRIPIFLPYLTGERTPHGDAAIRGAFYGLEDETSRGKMTRSIVDAIAYSFADAMDAFADNTAMPDPLLAIGGGAQSDLLLQTIADVTDCTVARTSDANLGPAIGACKLAAMSIGALARDELIAPPEGQRFEPNPQAKGRHEKRLRAYRGLYARLQSFPESLEF